MGLTTHTLFPDGHPSTTGGIVGADCLRMLGHPGGTGGMRFQAPINSRASGLAGWNCLTPVPLSVGDKLRPYEILASIRKVGPLRCTKPATCD
jgi:hypothetical protein